MNKSEFFDFLQYSYFTSKLTNDNTNFRFFKHYDPLVMAFIEQTLPQMNEQELSSILYFYANNKTELSEKYTYPEFFGLMFSQIRQRMD